MTLLDEVKGKLPRFGELLELLRSDNEHKASQRLQISIKAFYVDLFHLFRAIAQVFTRRNCSKQGIYVAGFDTKHRLLADLILMWQPLPYLDFDSI